MEIRKYVQSELDTLWEEYKRILNPQTYKVDLSKKLWDLKSKMIDYKNI